jgi:hypothetical protein
MYKCLSYEKAVEMMSFAAWFAVAVGTAVAIGLFDKKKKA